MKRLMKQVSRELDAARHSSRGTMCSLVLLVVLLSGCVYQQHGNRFNVESAKSLQPGVSTSLDAIALLGPPRATTTQATGDQLLQWQYVYGTAIGVGGGAHVAILFGPDKKMIRITHLSEQ